MCQARELVGRFRRRKPRPAVSPFRRCDGIGIHDSFKNYCHLACRFESDHLYFLLTICYTLKDVKYCANSNCKQENPQPEENFNKKGSGLQPWCRECNRERSRQYYAENREKHLRVIKDRQKRILREVRERLIAYFHAHPCVDCGEDDPVVLEPDHLRDKEHNISNMLKNGHSWEKILRELDKCEIVCCNCHRRRTYKRCGSYRMAACPEPG